MGNFIGLAYILPTTYIEYLFSRFVYRRMTNAGYGSAKAVAVLCFIFCFFCLHYLVFHFFGPKIEC